jgi:hypothetical protein
MTATNEFSLNCTEMGAHEAHVLYAGVVCQAGALALEHLLAKVFGYYKYRRITLSIESPGGAIDSLEYMLRCIQEWSTQGCSVAVRSTFQCASAAAFLLAMGEWGHRRVDRGTFLLFHGTRVEGQSMSAMTAALSSNLSTVLHSTDRKLLDVLMNRMLVQSGGATNLVDLVLARIRFVDQNWKDLAAKLTTFTAGVDGNRKPDWLKLVQRWSRLSTDPRRFVLEMKKHLNMRLQLDVRTDLCEAWVLCLIDEISGVLAADCAELAPAADALVDAPMSDVPHQVSSTHKDSPHENPTCFRSAS